MNNGTHNDLYTDSKPGDNCMYRNTVCLKDQKQQHNRGTSQEEENDEEEETNLKQTLQGTNNSSPTENGVLEHVEACLRWNKENDKELSLTEYRYKKFGQENNDTSGPSSGRSTTVDACFVSSMQDNDEDMHKCFLELKHRRDWQKICGAIGYSVTELLSLPVDGGDCLFVKLLMTWLNVIKQCGYRGMTHLYWAMESQEDECNIQRNILQIFRSTVRPQKPNDEEIRVVKDKLSKIKMRELEVSYTSVKWDTLDEHCGNQQRIIKDEERLFSLCKNIWDNLSESEVREIKTYLNMKDKKNFGKKALEKIKDGIDLVELLQKRDLLGTDKVHFLQEILDKIKRSDLISNICDYERRIQVPVVNLLPNGNRYKDTDSAQTDLDGIPIKIKEVEGMSVACDTSILNIQDDIGKRNKSIKSSQDTYRHLRKQQEETEEIIKVIDSDIKQLDDHIAKLQKEKLGKIQSKNLMKHEIDNIAREAEKENESLRQQEFDKQKLESMLEKENSLKKDCLIKIKTLRSNLEDNASFLRRLSSQTNRSETDNFNHIPDISTDALPTPPSARNLVSRGYREQHAKPPAKIPDPDPAACIANTKLLILAAEEDEEQVSAFHDDLNEAIGDKDTITCTEIVATKTMTKQFLNETDKAISKAILVFVLLSSTFTKDYWPAICEMKNLTSALYDKDSRPLIVPVAMEKNARFPMGMHSTHKLQFHRRDSYYKGSLAKLIAQEISAKEK